LWLHSLKVAQLLRSAACLHTNQSRSYLNHLVPFVISRVSHTWLVTSSFSPWVSINRPLSVVAVITWPSAADNNALFALHCKCHTVGLLPDRTVQLIGHILPCAFIRGCHRSFVNADNHASVSFLPHAVLKTKYSAEYLEADVSCLCTPWRRSQNVTALILNIDTRRNG